MAEAMTEEQKLAVEKLHEWVNWTGPRPDMHADTVIRAYWGLRSAYDALVAERERLLNLYQATVSGANKERERYEAWSADDNGKQVLTPAGELQTIINEQADATNVLAAG